MDANDSLKEIGIYKFEFGARTFTLDPSDYVPIDMANLSVEFAEQASKYAYIAILCSKADSTVRHSKAELDYAEAEADGKARALFDAEGKRTTEAMVANHVMINPEVKSKKALYIKAQDDYATLRAIESAMQMRSDMLIRIGAMERAEMGMTGQNTNMPDGMKLPKQNKAAAVNADIEKMKQKLSEKREVEDKQST